MTDDPLAIHVEAITTSDSLERIRPEWSRLWAEDPSATPFQSPEWLIPWWRHIAQGELWTLACRGMRDSDSPERLVGLIPLYIYTNPQSAMREVFPLGIATT
ncbi:MAG TPA: hypothetical protein VHP11_15030, partial [Tepidisphaeraceae bacterium]|nr:hypothetical protein [Tepidisphaeraceae bacterium]